MPKVDINQTNFSAGEIGPSLFGRTDLSQYASACALVENMLIRPYGSAISAPGSKLVGDCKSHTQKARLIPFIFNRTDALALELGAQFVRFLTADGLVTSTGTTPFEVITPYLQDEIKDVRYAQINDVIYFFHPNHPIQRLIRRSPAYWTFTELDLISSPYLDDNIIETSRLSASQSSGTVNITSSTTLFTVSSGTTRGHQNTFWKIGTAVTDGTTGIAYQGFVKLTHVINATAATATVISLLSNDVIAGVDLWAEGAWSDVNGWPSVGVFFSGRLWVARTDQEPQKLWGSHNFVFDDFTLHSSRDDEGINIQVASAESNEILWLVAGASLIAGTHGGEFVITSESGPITPTNIFARQQSSWGSENITPRRIGNYFYYLQRYGKKLRELFYFWDLDSYKSIDKTILSPEILGKGVVDIGYQESPDTIIYCVRTDGTIAAMTREIEQELTAWSRLSTDGIYEALAVIPATDGGLYDQIFTITKRFITDTLGTTVERRYLEHFQDIIVPDRQDLCWYLHSALRFSAYDESAGLGSSPTVVAISLSATDGTTVVVTSSTAYFTAESVGRRIRAIDEVGNSSGELTVTSFGSTSLVAGKVRLPFTALAYGGGTWGISVQTISGLDHLEGKNVGILADGGLDKPAKTVSLGSISLSYNYFIVLVGLPYTQKLQTLPPEAGSARGSAQGKIQRINQASFKVNRSFKGFKVGGTLATAEKIQFRDPSTLMGTPELLLTGTIPNITINDDYRYGSAITIVNDEPLPIELLSIITAVDTHDK